MKRILLLTSITLLAACNGAGTVYRPIEEDLNSERAQGFLNPEVQVSFGKSERVNGKKLMTYIANRRTNGSNKDAAEACQIAFLSAVKSLQDRAVKMGADAVVDIHSFYKRVPEWSTETYRCEDGNMVTAVTLQGTITKMF